MLKLKKFYRSLSGRIFLFNLLTFLPFLLIIAGSGAVIIQIARYQGESRLTFWISAYIISLASAFFLLFLQHLITRRRITDPLNRIRDAALELANGTQNIRITSLHRSPEEFIELAETFNYMVNHIEERNSKLMKVYSSLAEKEAMFRLISHNVPGIVYLISADDQSVLFINDRIEQHTGYASESFLSGGMSLFDLIVDEDRERVVNEISESSKAGIRFHVRFQLQRKDGDLRFFETFGTSFRTLKKEKVIEGFATDITEKMTYEINLQHSIAEKETLIKEVHHRVKNNLAMISSLIHLQQDSSRSAELQNGFDDLDHRIRSIALIHEKLYQSDTLSVINFNSYMSELAEQLKRGISTTGKSLEMNIDVDGIILPVDQCIPVGLIINELVTNSYKHAVNSSNIIVSIKMEYSDSEFTLTVRDNGRGIPEGALNARKDSIGTQLIEALAMQLGGEYRWFNDGGACFELSFPEEDPVL